MIDLNPFIPPDTQKRIGPVVMSDAAAEELKRELVMHGRPEAANPQGFGPAVATGASTFLDSAYFARSEWFRNQRVHTIAALQINPLNGPAVVPILHLHKTKHGYAVVSRDESPLPENYYEERVVEEVKFEMGII